MVYFCDESMWNVKNKMLAVSFIMWKKKTVILENEEFLLINQHVSSKKVSLTNQF